MAKSVLHTIEDNLSTFSKGQKRIGRYILDHYDQAAFMTASKLGKLTEVSESTVVRFAAELGFDGYPAMQKALQEMARNRLTSTQRIQAAENIYDRDVLSSVLQADIENLRQISMDEDRDTFQTAVEKIVHARHIYILGARSSTHLAGYLYFYMQMIFENVTLLPELEIGLHYGEDGLQHMTLNGTDVTDQIRLPEISLYASAVSAHPAVRAHLLEMQRKLARENNVVMDGRDIGTVVLPDATVKIFLTASVEERAMRRFRELEQRGTPESYEKVLEEMRQRDYNDSHRAAAPLKQAEDAVLLDTTELDFHQSEEAILRIIRERTSR